MPKLNRTVYNNIQFRTKIKSMFWSAWPMKHTVMNCRLVFSTEQVNNKCDVIILSWLPAIMDIHCNIINFYLLHSLIIHKTWTVYERLNVSSPSICLVYRLMSRDLFRERVSGLISLAFVFYFFLINTFRERFAGDRCHTSRSTSSDSVIFQLISLSSF